MKLFSLFLTAVAAQNTERESRFVCPANSQATVSTPLDMQDCKCDTGFAPKPFPAVGCDSLTAAFSCPAGISTSKVAVPKSIVDCKCNNGYVAYDGQCQYAYMFHVHGRVYLRAADAAQATTLDNAITADQTKFANAMSDAMGASVTAADVLPYRVTKVSQTQNIQAAFGADKIILAHGHWKKQREAERDITRQPDSLQTVVVSFALHKRANAMSVGNKLVDELRDTNVDGKLSSLNGTALHDSVTIDAVDVYVWALTAQFWHPPASIAACRPVHVGFEKADSSSIDSHYEESYNEWTNTHYHDDADKNSKHDTRTCKFCKQDWQCEPADCFKDGAPTPFNQAELTAGEQVCKTQPTCAQSNDNSGKYCFRPYTWATNNTGFDHTGPHAPTREPTKRATMHPTQRWVRAKIEVPVTFAGIAPAHITYNTRAGLLGKFAELLAGSSATLKDLTTTEVYFVNIHPIRAGNPNGYDDATYHTHHSGEDVNHYGYNPSHHATNPATNGTVVVFGVYTYSHAEAEAVVSQLACDADDNAAVSFANSTHSDYSGLASDVTANAPFTGFLSGLAGMLQGVSSSDVHVGTCNVRPVVVTSPTVKPTSAPTMKPGIPGSTGSCTSGTVMEIRGTARVQSLYNLEAPLNRAFEFMDNATHGLRHCMADKSTATESQACNMVVLNWNVKRIAIFKDELAAHQHADRGVKTFSKYAYIYTFAFAFAVNGQNMHHGNEVFQRMTTDKFVSDVNYCTSQRTVSDKILKPTPYHEGTKLSVYDEDMFSEPMVETLNLTSIELTYVRKTPTQSPTAPPTWKVENCQLSDWSSWTACSQTCGAGGRQRAWRIIEKAAVGIAAGEPGACGSEGFKTYKERECTSDSVASGYLAVCPSDCTYQPWNDWGACDVSCGKGSRTRTRSVTQASHDGKLCVASSGGSFSPATLGAGDTGTESQVKDCQERQCPVDCAVSDWDTGAACTKTCGGGQQTAYRRILTAPQYGGKACPKLSETTDCNIQACPTDCEVSKWSAWGSCSKTCSGKPAGTRLFGARQERTRYVVQEPDGEGVPCPALTQQRLCALHPCGAHVCTTNHGFPLTCTYENGVVYTHHVNDVHDNELFMCYHNYVTEVCTCLCWQKADLGHFTDGTAHGETGIARISRKAYDDQKNEVVRSPASDVSLFAHDNSYN